MTALGAFRDDYYNAAASLTTLQSTSITAATPVTISAQQIAGAQIVDLVASTQSTAQAWTTDTAANIIAWLQSVVAAAYKAQIQSFGQTVNPAFGVPNLFNLTYQLTIVNNDTSTGVITLTGGTGVTISGTATVAIATAVVFQFTVQSPTAVTYTRLYSYTVGA